MPTYNHFYSSVRTNFVNGLAKLAKKEKKKNNANKIFIEIKNIMDTISKIIFFPNEYFSFDFFALIILWKAMMIFS